MQGDTHSFVVRIWHEALDDQGHIAAWRGSIERVGDTDRTYFVDLSEIACYIEGRIGLRPQGVSAPSAGQNERGLP